jgi:hypothetical protein
MTQATLDIGMIVRNAVVFNPKQKGLGKRMAETSLLEAVDRLFALLNERHIDYLLVGGVALLQYIDGRNTEDIDLIMAVAALERLPEIQIESRDEFFASGRLDALRIDFLFMRNRLFRHVRQSHATQATFGQRVIPCATVEGLLLLKLYALPSLYRQGDFQRVALYEGDVAMLMERYRPDTSVLLAELTRYLAESDVTVVRLILLEIEQRIERFRNSQRS